MLVPSRTPFHLVLLRKASTGPLLLGSVTPSKVSCSNSTICRFAATLTPGAAAPAAGLTSLTMAGSWFAPPRRAPPVAGLKVVSLPESGSTTWNCMNWPSRLGFGGSPPGKVKTAVLVSVSVFPSRPAKSMITSARSDGANSSLGALGSAGSLSLTGLSSRPPSVPICQKATAEGGVGEEALAASVRFMARNRALVALRKRKR